VAGVTRPRYPRPRDNSCTLTGRTHQAGPGGVLCHRCPLDAPARRQPSAHARPLLQRHLPPGRAPGAMPVPAARTRLVWVGISSDSTRPNPGAAQVGEYLLVDSPRRPRRPGQGDIVEVHVTSGHQRHARDAFEGIEGARGEAVEGRLGQAIALARWLLRGQRVNGAIWVTRCELREA
jgi:hypothetical protein